MGRPRRFLFLFGLAALLCLGRAPEARADESASDMSRAWTFAMEQKAAVDRCLKAAPAEGKTISRAYRRFEAAFGPAVDALDAAMGRANRKQWDAAKTQIKARLAKNLDALAPGKCGEAARLIDERAGGKIESPVLETLLRRHPRYRDHPERELADGFSRDQVLAANDGRRVSLRLPATWKQIPCRGAACLAVFMGTSLDRAQPALHISLMPKAPSPVGDETEALQRLLETWKHTAKADFAEQGLTADTIETAKTNLAGRPAGRLTFILSGADHTKKRVRFAAGLTLAASLDKVHLLCMAEVTPPAAKSASQAKAALKTYEPLFLAIAASLTVGPSP